MTRKANQPELESLDEIYEDDCSLCQIMKDADKRGEVFEFEVDLSLE